MELTAVLARINSMPAPLRWSAGSAVLMLVLAIAVATSASHASRVALFSQPLHPDQLGEVDERLAEWNVAFTPAADNVLVDRAQRNTLLLRLSLAGVPHEHVDTSSDLLNKLGALTPQTVIDQQSRDGLSGDIEVALRGIEGVSDARVIIAPARPGYFAGDESRDATASVRLRLVPDTLLSNDTVSGIREFVAAAVPGLNAGNVTIVDDRGVALSDTHGTSEADSLMRSLQTALDAAVGPGTTVVRVHVEYDPRTISSRDVRHEPISTGGISEQHEDEHYAAEGKKYVRSSTQLDRGTASREVTASYPSGRIARISAAVFVNATAVTDLSQIKSLAAATLGIDYDRGDTLEVAPVLFKHSAPARGHDGWWFAYGAVVPALPVLIIATAMLIAMRWGAGPMVQFLRSVGDRAYAQKTAQSVRNVTPAKVRGALMDEPPHTAAAIISALPTATAAAVLDMYPESERAAIIRRMQRPRSPLLGDPEEYINHA